MPHNETLSAGDCIAVSGGSDTVFVHGHGFYVGSVGDVTIQTHKGVNVLFAAVPTGMIIPVSFRRIMQTGTAASSIVALLP